MAGSGDGHQPLATVKAFCCCAALAAQQARRGAQLMRAWILGYLSMSMLAIAVWVHPPRNPDSPD
jgi:hypothetical protein